MYSIETLTYTQLKDFFINLDNCNIIRNFNIGEDKYFLYIKIGTDGYWEYTDTRYKYARIELYKKYIGNKGVTGNYSIFNIYICNSEGGFEFCNKIIDTETDDNLHDKLCDQMDNTIFAKDDSEERGVIEANCGSYYIKDAFKEIINIMNEQEELNNKLESFTFGNLINYMLSDKYSYNLHEEINIPYRVVCERKYIVSACRNENQYGTKCDYINFDLVNDDGSTRNIFKFEFYNKGEYTRSISIIFNTDLRLYGGKSYLYASLDRNIPILKYDCLDIALNRLQAAESCAFDVKPLIRKFLNIVIL